METITVALGTPFADAAQDLAPVYNVVVDQVLPADDSSPFPTVIYSGTREDIAALLDAEFGVPAYEIADYEV